MGTNYWFFAGNGDKKTLMCRFSFCACVKCLDWRFGECTRSEISGPISSFDFASRKRKREEVQELVPDEAEDHDASQASGVDTSPRRKRGRGRPTGKKRKRGGFGKKKLK